jgi:hypothetical protein
MGTRGIAAPALLALSGLALAGCGHDHHDYFDADPSGVYEGSLTDTVNKQATPVVAVIDENGDGRMIDQNGTYYALGVNTSGDGVFGQYLAFPGNGVTTAGSLQGELLNSAANLDATLSAAGADPLALALNYDNVYSVPSSLPTLQGNWAYSGSEGSASSFSLNLAIQPTGAFSGTDSNNCSYSGFFHIVDPQFDAYSEDFTLTCPGTGSTAAPVRYFGLAYYIPAGGKGGSSSGGSATPAEINFLADDDNGHFVSTLLQYTGALTGP